MIVEGDIGRRHFRTEPCVNADRCAVVGSYTCRSQPHARAWLSRHHAGVLGQRQRFDRPLIRLLVALRPRVSHHVVGRRVEFGDARVVDQHRQQQLLRFGRENDDGGLVAPEVVDEEFGQALAIERGARRAALVQLVQDAPRLIRPLAIGEAEVRIAQAVRAEVLSGARENDDSGAAAVELRGGPLGQCHGAGDCGCRDQPPLT